MTGLTPTLTESLDVKLRLLITVPPGPTSDQVSCALFVRESN
jgi:hypothetical protein